MKRKKPTRAEIDAANAREAARQDAEDRARGWPPPETRSREQILAAIHRHLAMSPRERAKHFLRRRLPGGGSVL